MKDLYLIEYLVENGYSREDVVSPSFNIDSIKDDFTTPIDLSQVENIDELEVFLAVRTSYLVREEDVTSGKVYKLSEKLINFELIGIEPGIKLDKLYMPPNHVATIRDNDVTHYTKNIKLKNFNLEAFNPVRDVTVINRYGEQEINNYCRSICLASNFENNKTRFLDIDVKTQYSFEVDDCSNLDIAVLNGLVYKAIINDGKNMTCSNQLGIDDFTIDGYKDTEMNFLSNVMAKDCRLNGLAELDLKYLEQTLESFGGSIKVSNVEKCYASKNINGSRGIEFTKTNFSGFNSNVINLPKVEMISCEQADNKVPFITAEIVEIVNSDFDLLFSTEPNSYLKLANCFNTDARIEEFVDRGKTGSFSFTAERMQGYDMRRTLDTLDLNLEETQDLLMSTDRLRDVLIDNKYLKFIKVNERLTDEQKAILGELAPEVTYEYVSDASQFYDKDNKYGEHVNFSGFIKAEKIFEDIVSGINESWTELEKFKYIYNALGKIVSYDINVLDKNEDRASYDQANIIARNPFSSIVTGQGVCAGYADMYMYVCKKAGLSCKTESSSGHRYNIIEYQNAEGDIVSSYCDLTWDAKNIKGNLKCKNFGKSKKTFLGHENLQCQDAVDIPVELVEDIDNKIGYNYMNKRYLDVVKEALQMDGTENKVKFLLENVMKVQDVSSMNNHEVVDFARMILVNCEISNKDTGVSNAFIRKDAKYDKDVRDILWVKDRDDKENERYLYYTFNAQQQSFKELDYDVVEELLSAGMLEFYKGQKLPGFENWISEKEYIKRRNEGQER